MEITLIELICYALICLMGTEGKDWEYPETDPEWWTLHLYTRRN